MSPAEFFRRGFAFSLPRNPMNEERQPRVERVRLALQAFLSWLAKGIIDDLVREVSLPRLDRPAAILQLEAKVPVESKTLIPPGSRYSTPNPICLPIKPERS